MDEQHCQVYQRSFGRSKIGFTMRDIRRCLKVTALCVLAFTIGYLVGYVV